MPNIKEIAPKLTQKLSIAINDDEAVEFAEALIAEIAKQNKPVAEVLSLFPGEPDSYINARAIGVDPFNTWTFPQPGTKLYTSDQVAAAVLKATKPIDGVAKPAGYFQVEFYGGNPMHQQVGSQYQAELGVFPLYTAQAVTVAVNQFKEQLAKAEQRIAELIAELEHIREQKNLLWFEFSIATQQLAASQAYAEQLREALSAAEKTIDIVWVSHHASRCDRALELCRKALSTPASTEALDKYVAEKVKEAMK